MFSFGPNSTETATSRKKKFSLSLSRAAGGKWSESAFFPKWRTIKYIEKYAEINPKAAQVETLEIFFCCFSSEICLFAFTWPKEMVSDAKTALGIFDTSHDTVQK